MATNFLHAVVKCSGTIDLDMAERLVDKIGVAIRVLENQDDHGEGDRSSSVS